MDDPHYKRYWPESKINIPHYIVNKCLYRKYYFILITIYNINDNDRTESADDNPD